MKAKVAGLSPNALRSIAAATILVYAAAAWLLFVSPMRSDAAQAKADLAAAESRLADARADAQRPSRGGVRVSEVLRLVKAMPSSADQAGLVLELTKLAEKTGLDLDSIAPQSATVGAGGATMIPVSVAVEGSFRGITRFLAQARTLVAVRAGRLHTRGRLLTVQSVELAESSRAGFPTLAGTIVLQAYVYDGPIAPPEVPDTSEGGTETEPTGGQAAGSTD